MWEGVVSRHKTERQDGAQLHERSSADGLRDAPGQLTPRPDPRAAGEMDEVEERERESGEGEGGQQEMMNGMESGGSGDEQAAKSKTKGEKVKKEKMEVNCLAPATRWMNVVQGST